MSTVRLSTAVSNASARFLPASSSSLQSAALDGIWSAHGFSSPLDAFEASYQVQLRDVDSAARRELIEVFKASSDLHVGWQPSARVQHLCTGASDEEVPPSIAMAAAERWGGGGEGGGMSAINLAGLGHTEGIIRCTLIALGNVTERVSEDPNVASSNSSLSGTNDDKDPKVYLTPGLLSWRRVDVGVLAAVSAVILWLIASARARCGRHKRRSGKHREKCSSGRTSGDGAHVRSTAWGAVLHPPTQEVSCRCAPPMPVHHDPVMQLSRDHDGSVEHARSAGWAMQWAAQMAEQSAAALEIERQSGTILQPSTLDDSGAKPQRRIWHGSSGDGYARSGDLVRRRRRRSNQTLCIRCQQRFLRGLLVCPCCVSMAATVVILGALSFFAYQSVLDAIDDHGQLFDLEIASLRSVNGAPLTDRQDAFDLIRAASLRSPHLSLDRVATTAADKTATGTSGTAAGLPSARVLQRNDNSEESVQSTRSVTLFYSIRGGRNETAAGGGSRIHGNVLSHEALRRIRNLESSIVQLSGDENVVNLESAVPCFFGTRSEQAEGANASSPTIAQENSGPSRESMQACLGSLVEEPSLRRHFSSDFSSAFANGDAKCAALRSFLTIDASADFDAWLRMMDARYDEQIEVSWYGDSNLFWLEFNINVLHDASLVGVSMAALLIIIIAVLRLPLFACVSLSCVVLSFPVAFVFYVHALGQKKLPILAVVSLYLVLGIGVDAIFVFTNTCAIAFQMPFAAPSSLLIYQVC